MQRAVPFRVFVTSPPSRVPAPLHAPFAPPFAPPLAIARHAAGSARGTAGAGGGGRSEAAASLEDLDAARTWLAQLHAETIPKAIGELSFSRSSGPGGQNVNKVNSKATLKVPLDALLRHVPSALHPKITSSRYVAERSNALIIHADDSRKQSDNAQSCYRRLYQAIVDAGRAAVPGETSAEQAEHVKKLQKSDNEHRLKSKKQHSAKKTARRGRADD